VHDHSACENTCRGRIGRHSSRRSGNSYQASFDEGSPLGFQAAGNGDYGELAVKEPVHRNEKIRTSKSGLGEFLFRDGTKFAVGP